MPRADREHLNKRREALRQEISTIREAIIDMQQQAGGADQMDKLQNLKTVLAIRERELNDVEGRLARKT